MLLSTFFVMKLIFPRDNRYFSSSFVQLDTIEYQTQRYKIFIKSYWGEAKKESEYLSYLKLNLFHYVLSAFTCNLGDP